MKEERKVIAIVGASAGHGPQTARQLAKEGHHVVLGARRSKRLHALMNEIRNAGGSAEWFALNSRNSQQLGEFLAFARDVHKRVDVVINV